MDRLSPRRFFPVLAVAVCLAGAGPRDESSRKNLLLRNALASVRAAAVEIGLDTMRTENPGKIREFWDSLAYLDTALAPPTGWRLAFRNGEFRTPSEAERRERTVAFEIALGLVKNVANGFIREKLDTARQRALLDPLELFQVEEARDALAARMLNLELLEIKYGPNSARLNFPEILVNHFLLRNLDAFGLDASGRPGAWEAVLAYSVSYVTPSWSGQNNLGVAFASAFEGGFRRYFLRHGWGKNALMPAYMSAGILMAAREEGVLRGPFEWSFDAEPAWGGFFSWGEVKAGIIYDGEPRLYLNRQFQFVPYIF